jgi:hypothetical protein
MSGLAFYTLVLVYACNGPLALATATPNVRTDTTDYVFGGRPRSYCPFYEKNQLFCREEVDTLGTSTSSTLSCTSIHTHVHTSIYTH